MTADDQDRWRVGTHFDIHVYRGAEPVATFHNSSDAHRAVDAVNGTHRVCTNAEHDPANGRFHGCCVICGEAWPCARDREGALTEAEILDRAAQIIGSWSSTATYPAREWKAVAMDLHLAANHRAGRLCPCGYPENKGHGHVHPRAFTARCGGPALCLPCAEEAAMHAQWEASQ